MIGAMAVVTTARKAMPLKAWLALACVSALAGGVWWGHAQWEALRARDFERGRLHERQVSQLDSIWRANLARQQRAAEHRTDSVRRTVQRARSTLTHAVEALPPELAALPPVQRVVRSAMTVAQESEALTAAVDVERALARMRQTSDSALIATQRVIIAVQLDSITTLKRRPTWRVTTLVTVSAVVVTEIARAIARSVP